MKILLAAHGYPPEILGGTELSVQAAARGLVDRGHSVTVVAGSMTPPPEGGTAISEGPPDPTPAGGEVRVVRIHRRDLYFDHWQKSASPGAAAAFRELLRGVRPDLVHVHHWIRLSRDLVAVAAREGVPAVVTLHDHWAGCLVSFRVRPDTLEPCDVLLAPSPCISCAANIPPRTPWLAGPEQALLLAERTGDLRNELDLARAVLVPSPAHGQDVERFLGMAQGELGAEVLAPGRDLAIAASTAIPAPRSGERLCLGAWSHLHPLKGPDILLAALAGTRDASRFELHLAGGEPDAAFAEGLHRAAADLPQGTVHFHGPFGGPESLAAHPVTAVHAAISGTRARESWGLVVDEALALGLPLILPRSGAFPDRLQEGRGAMFYDPGDAHSLAQLLDRVADDPALLEAARAAAPALVEAAPGMQVHLDGLCAVYERVVQAGAPPVEPEPWWQARVRQAAEEGWDQSLSACTSEDLGLDGGGKE